MLIPGQVRRSLALVSVALLVALPLSSCGFDRATDRVNNIAQGGTNRDGTIDVLNAVVVSAEEGSGTLIVTLVNNDQEEEGSLEGLTPGDDRASVEDFSPINVPAAGLVNLAADGEEGVPVTGDFGPGDSLPMTFQLSGGEVVDLDVPVVHNCYEYAGIDGDGGECEVAEPAGEH